MVGLLKVKPTEDANKGQKGSSEGEESHQGGSHYQVSNTCAFVILFLAFVLGYIGGSDLILNQTRCIFSLYKTKTAEQKTLAWWQTSIIYQIYPRSFMDSNGDGVGDLKGVTSKLDYLTYLNLGVLWMSPFFESPMADFGYDLSNQTRVDPIFGTMVDFEELLFEAHRRDIRVILDYIPNHTSDQHPWFIESRKDNSSDNPYRDYYVWENGVTLPNNTRTPPNNWLSFFSGSAWQYDAGRDQYYLHQYLREQPDLNWRNPLVQQEMENVIRFWLDKGVDGFRIDAVQTLYETEDVTLNEPRSHKPNVNEVEHDYFGHIYTQNQPETHEVIRSWRDVFDDYERKDDKKRFMVVEVYDEDIDQVVSYYQSGADMAFYFDLLKLIRSCGGECIQNLVSRLLDALPPGKWPNFVLGNHDNKRIGTKMGSEFVNALNMLLLLLPGTPTTYQGEEIGLENIEVSYEDTQDPYGKLYGPDRYLEVSRDPERSPMQWENSYQSGFTTAPKAWLPVHPLYPLINVQTQMEVSGASHLKLYRDLSYLREDVSFQLGAFHYIFVNENIFSFVRRAKGHPAYLVVLNFGNKISMHDYSGEATGRSGEIIFTTQNFQHHIYEIGQRLDLDYIVLSPGQGLVIKLDQ